MIYPELPNVYIKRDDFIGSLVWGNKLRKLEYALAEAKAHNADTIITCGSIHSNHARITGQVCRRLELDCILVQNGDKPESPSGNALINKMLDIPIHYVSSPDERQPKMDEIADELEAAGHTVYQIPLGASNATGSLGFVAAVEELVEQQQKMDIRFNAIIHACSSGGTQAGLEVGKRLFGLDKLQIYGISADNSAEKIKETIAGITYPIINRLGFREKMCEEDLHVDDSYVGEGYGIPTELSSKVTRQFLQIEGIMLDPTYTAKAAAGLVDYSRRGKFKSTDNVLFWHTGGLLNLL
ncbi:MAG: D-cysteine desulfhydrase family protein [Balneolaceae bacterium]|nr:D-cysteine desulfhydrase family protein [Balneolaceae bacterium]